MLSIGKKKSSKPSQFERGYRILQYLKQNTDKNNKVEQRDLRNVEALREFMCHPETYNALVYNMAYVLNGDRPEEEWQIIFDQCSQKVGTRHRASDEDSEESEKNVFRISNLYYQPIFTYDEIDSMIEGIQFSKTLGKKNKISLSQK